jgi:hypothetical protein
MPTQSQLIGNHPPPPDIFQRWLRCNDVAVTASKCHRSLGNLIPTTDEQLIEWLAQKLIQHHYEDTRLERLKQKYREIGYPQYAEQHRKLPRLDTTKKGNAAEIILVEYIESCQNKVLTKVFRLRYNPNVDQSMKGDDALLVDIYKDEKGADHIKIFLGEAKYRQTPSAAVVKEIANALDKDKKPLSYSFLVEELLKDDESVAIGDLLDKFIVQEVKSRSDIIYAGFLLSNQDTFRFVENNLASNNPSMVFISTGIQNSQELIDAAYGRAEALLLNPETL